MEILAGVVSEVVAYTVPTQVGQGGEVATKKQAGFLLDGKPVSFTSNSRAHFSLGDTVVVAGFQMPEGFWAQAFVNVTNGTYGREPSLSGKIYILPAIGFFLFMLYGLFLDKLMRGSAGWALCWLICAAVCGVVAYVGWDGSSKALKLCQDKAKELKAPGR